MKSSTQFLVLSSVRSGSTWLATMLGSLADVTVDYEFKWLTKACPYPLSPVHMHIPDGSFSCAKALESLPGDTPVKGSKLTLDACVHEQDEYDSLARTIEKDIRIIHLRRRYRDVCLALSRGCLHLMNENVAVASQNVLLSTIADGQANLSDRLQAAPHRLDPDQCRGVLHSLAANDRWAQSLARQCRDFIVVDYDAIQADFFNLARFVGSKATTEELNATLRHPPTKKLPPLPFEKAILNYAELLPLFEAYDRIYLEGTV